MATHELPEWEVPPSDAKKLSFFSRQNLFSASSSNHKPSVLSKTSPKATFHSKEQDPPSETAKTDRGIFSNRWIPHWCSCFGRSRKTCLCSIIALVILIVLIIGLAVGLTHHKPKSQDLPLPSNTGIFTGDLTFYSPGPGYGACGYENTSADAICAVSHIVWDAASTSTNSNNNPLCGKKIRITRYDPTVGGNRSVDVEVVDRCVGCKVDDLDLSLAMFDSLAEEAQGRVVGSWAWLS